MPEVTMKVSVISHSADVDGLMAAFFAMVREEARGNSVSVTFSDYDGLLENVEAAEGEIIYVCDLGIDREKEEKFLSLVRQKISAGRSFTYIDHHPDNPSTLKELEKTGATVVHSLSDCAGVLAYSTFSHEVPRKYMIYAAYAAIGDHMENGKEASKIMTKVDSIMAYFEASVLTLAIDKRDSIKLGLLSYLKESQFAHRYPGVMDAAEKQLSQMEEFTKRSFEVMKGKNYSWAFAECNFFTGRAATLMLQMLPIDIAIAYRMDDERKAYDVSFRCSDKSEMDLGALAHDAAASVGGTGGGHRRASGASVPASRLDEFIKAVAERL